MSFNVSETPFRVLVRPDPALDGAIVVQFEVLDGMGVLGLRKIGRDEPQPTTHYEETEVEAEALRAGRFVHVLNGGTNRQSYALSRITGELIRRLPVDAWTELRPVTEYGFRYLVVPEDLAAKPPVATAAQVIVPGSAAAQGIAAGPQVAVASTSGTPAPAGTASVPPRAASLPPRPVPMEPSLAAAALERLTREEAIELLRGEMAKVDGMHARLAELERALDASRAREQDLLGVLARWQQM